MSEHELEPLTPQIQALLEEERLPEPLPSGARERLWGELARTLDLPPGGPGGDGGPEPGGTAEEGAAPDGGGGAAVGEATSQAAASTSSAAGAAAAGGVSKLAAALWAAASFAVGAGAGAGAMIVTADPEQPAPRVVERIVEVPAAPEELPPAPASAAPPEEHEAAPPEVVTEDAGGDPAPVEPDEEPPRPREPASEKKLAPVEAKEETGAGVGQLAAERRLLARAQAALGRGRPEAALEALEEHVSRYPKGALAEEREALEVQALRQAGEEEQAQRAAETFLKRWPRSIFRSVVAPAAR